MAKEWKIYTKTGDKGTTALIGGKRVPKYHTRIEAYGTVDELNAFVGLIRDQQIDDHSKAILLEIQNKLFTLETALARDKSSIQQQLPELNAGDVSLLEHEIDLMNERLPELTAFVLPGGHPTVSLCHVARTVCRRAERLTIKMNEEYPVPPINIQYLNRLSDYLFVLARKFTHDFGVDELLWKA
jgi:cob(I)alamin adenosyltransferase